MILRLLPLFGTLLAGVTSLFISLFSQVAPGEAMKRALLMGTVTGGVLWLVIFLWESSEIQRPLRIPEFDIPGPSSGESTRQDPRDPGGEQQRKGKRLDLLLDAQPPPSDPTVRQTERHGDD